MPNPLSRVLPDASYEYGPASLAMRPNLAVQIMTIIANISAAENARGLILAEMLGVEEHLALLIYMEVKSANAKSNAFEAISKLKLSPEENSLLKEINKKTKAILNRRNEFAHGIWGVADRLPDAILWIPSDHYLDHVLEHGSGKKHVMAMLHDRNKVMVYTNNDLSKETARSERASALYFSFHSMLKFRINKEELHSEEHPSSDFFSRIHDQTRKQIIELLATN